PRTSPPTHADFGCPYTALLPVASGIGGDLPAWGHKTVTACHRQHPGARRRFFGPLTPRLLSAFPRRRDGRLTQLQYYEAALRSLALRPAALHPSFKVFAPPDRSANVTSCSTSERTIEVRGLAPHNSYVSPGVP